MAKKPEKKVAAKKASVAKATKAPKVTKEKPLKKGEVLVEFASRLSEPLDAQISKKDAAVILEVLVGLAYDEAKRGFVIPGLGKFSLKDKPARMGRNPRTGEQVKIPAKTVVKFRVAKQAKEALCGSTKKKK